MKMKRILVIALTLLSVVATGCVATDETSNAGSTTENLQPEVYIEAQVVKVIDGDTIDVTINNETHRVRYIGIDAPELDQPFGEEALLKNRELVEGKTVKLEKDVSDTDQYGRLLRYVYVNDLLVNGELVRLGYAEAVEYPPDTKYQELFDTIQADAKKSERGIWTISPTITPPTKPETDKIIPPPRD